MGEKSKQYMNAIQPSGDLGKQIADLHKEIDTARRELLEAEADLSREQAAVNAFRMHCRLKLDKWIDQLLALQVEKQKLRIQSELLRQADGYGRPFDEEDPFWHGEETELEEDSDDEELLLPTDTPHDKAAEQRLYRQLARKYHPDLAQTAVEIAYRTDMMVAVNNAYAEGDVHALYDLADQIDPVTVEELSAIKSAELRALKTDIIRLRRRKRRANRRLSTLQQENTARLWQKAKRLDTDDVHWWEIVRKEIEAAAARTKNEIEALAVEVFRLETPPDSFNS